MLTHQHQLAAWLAPPFFLLGGNYVGNLLPFDGLPDFERGLLTALTMLTLIAVAAICAFGNRTADRKTSQNGATVTCPSPSIDCRSLYIVVLPCLAAYLILLIPRAAFIRMFDRYLLVPMFFLLLLTIRTLHRSLQHDLPRATSLLIALAAAITIAQTHDLFSRYRAIHTAASQLEADGVPRTSIDGSWEFNTWTEITLFGTLPPQDPNFMAKGKIGSGGLCPPLLGYVTPHVVARYSFSRTPNACAGPAPFPPVSYTTWLPHRTLNLYVVHNPMPANFWATHHTD